MVCTDLAQERAVDIGAPSALVLLIGLFLWTNFQNWCILAHLRGHWRQSEGTAAIARKVPSAMDGAFAIVFAGIDDSMLPDVLLDEGKRGSLIFAFDDKRANDIPAAAGDSSILEMEGEIIHELPPPKGLFPIATPKSRRVHISQRHSG
jgi:hypothetical protein